MKTAATIHMQKYRKIYNEFLWPITSVQSTFLFWCILNLFYLSKFAVTTNPTSTETYFYIREEQQRVYFISWIIVRTFNEWNLCLNLYEWERSIDVRSFNVPHKWLTDLYQWLIISLLVITNRKLNKLLFYIRFIIQIKRWIVIQLSRITKYFGVLRVMWTQ